MLRFFEKMVSYFEKSGKKYEVPYKKIFQYDEVGGDCPPPLVHVFPKPPKIKIFANGTPLFFA